MAASRPRPDHRPWSSSAEHAAAHRGGVTSTPVMKKHARFRDRPRGQVLFADDPDDWEAMRTAGRNGLRCPEDDCTAVLTPRESHRGTRFLAYVPQQQCGHDHWTPEGGGGPVSEQHRWLQRRLVAMARHMGYEPIAEHPPTRADVYVPEKGLAIEVQLRPTRFQARSAARRAAGATAVLWMLSAEALPTRHQGHLFAQPAVRWRALHRRTKKEVRPWEDPSTDGEARVQVYGTVAVASRGSEGLTLTTRPMDGYAFLQEVLRGARVWFPPGTPGMPVNRAGLVSGGWARPEELRAAQAAPRAGADVPAAEEAATGAPATGSPADVPPIAEVAPPPEAERREPDADGPTEALPTVPDVSSAEAGPQTVADWPEYVPEYRVVPVDRLPRAHPFRADCMGPPAAAPPRRWWRRWSRRIPDATWSGRADCCWYHRGDWPLACGVAVAEVERALASGTTGWAVRDRVLSVVRESVTDPWQLQAIESLVDPATAMVIDEPQNCFVNGQHRAVAMRDQGVRATVVL